MHFPAADWVTVGQGLGMIDRTLRRILGHHESAIELARGPLLLEVGFLKLPWVLIWCLETDLEDEMMVLRVCEVRDWRIYEDLWRAPLFSCLFKLHKPMKGKCHWSSIAAGVMLTTIAWPKEVQDRDWHLLIYPFPAGFSTCEFHQYGGDTSEQKWRDSLDYG